MAANYDARATELLPTYTEATWDGVSTLPTTSLPKGSHQR